MPLFSASIDVFLLTSIALIASWSFLAIQNPTRKTLQVHTLLNIFVLLHTISILYTLVLRTPPNIFTRLGIPLTTSSDIIRQTLLKYATPEGSLPKHLDTLVKRLSSFDARNIYVRYALYTLYSPSWPRYNTDSANLFSKIVNIATHTTNTPSTPSPGLSSHTSVKRP